MSIPQSPCSDLRLRDASEPIPPRQGSPAWPFRMMRRWRTQTTSHLNHAISEGRWEERYEEGQGLHVGPGGCTSATLFIRAQLSVRRVGRSCMVFQARLWPSKLAPELRTPDTSQYRFPSPIHRKRPHGDRGPISSGRFSMASTIVRRISFVSSKSCQACSSVIHRISSLPGPCGRRTLTWRSAK